VNPEAGHEKPAVTTAGRQRLSATGELTSLGAA
jgi:hypothetical protein